MKDPNLVFDLYGTLVDIHTEEDTPEIWQKLAFFYGYHGAGYAPQELRTAWQAALAAQDAAAGQSYEGFPDLPIEPIFAQLFTAKGVPAGESLPTQAAQLYRVLCTEYLRLYPGVKEALAALRADGHRLWLLSNAQAAYTAPEIRFLGLEPCFDAMYLSSDYRCRKPDPAFFRVLLDGQKLDPADCLMIGNDATTDVAGANAVGMDALYLHTNLSPQIPAKTARYLLEETDWSRILSALRQICAE